MATCGTGGWNGPQPGDPDDSIALSATGGSGGILVSWNYPGLNPSAVAHFKVYRNTTSSFIGATHVYTIQGDRVFDDCPPNSTFFYWVRTVSIYGTDGTLIGPASATSLDAVIKLLEQLTAKIDAGLLATALRNEIDAIPTNRAAFDQEVLDRIAADDVLALSVTAAGTDASQAVALISSEIDARTTATSALASSIDTVAVALGEDVAAVQVTAQAGLDKANALGALYHVRVGVNGLSGGFGIYNDGTTVQAGFDVDEFFVGRTGPDKVKPFIINQGVVYIDEARIATLNADKINAGTLQAARIAVGSIDSRIATIQSAQIADAAITNAKINDLAAEKINAGTLNAARISTGSLNADRITIGTLQNLAISQSAYGVVYGPGSTSSFTFNGANVQTSNRAYYRAVTRQVMSFIWLLLSGGDFGESRKEAQIKVRSFFGNTVNSQMTTMMYQVVNVTLLENGLETLISIPVDLAVTTNEIGHIQWNPRHIVESFDGWGANSPANYIRTIYYADQHSMVETLV